MKATVFNVKHPHLLLQSRLTCRPLPSTLCSQALSQVRIPQHSAPTGRPLSSLLELTPQSADTPTWVISQSPPAEGLNSVVPVSCPPPKPAPHPRTLTTGAIKRQMGQTQGWRGVTPEGGRSCVCLLWAYHLLGPQLSAVGIVQSKQKKRQAESKYF